MAAEWRVAEEAPGRFAVVGPRYHRALPCSRDFLTALADHRRGPELIDELLRSEHPPYILDRLRALLRGHAVSSWRVLDFGCGAGASAVSLARLGVRQIVGIDVVNAYARIWLRRLAEAGFPSVGYFVQAGGSRTLPFRDGQFDAAFLNGLVEHLLPEERTDVLREVFRTIRPGGHLFLTETPNRWFPRNSHTKLWFSEFLPLAVAARLASRWGPRRDFPTRGRTAIYRTGIRGASARGISLALGAEAEPAPVDEELAAMEFQLPRNPLQATAAKLEGGARVWPHVRRLARLTGISPHALAPHLNLAYRKRESRA